MKGNTMNIFPSVLLPLVLGIVVAVIVFAALTGRSLPLIDTPRASLLALLVVGMAMCAGGIGQVGASGRWASPLAILGYLLGALILVIILAAFAGWRLPLISGDTAGNTAGYTRAVAAVGILIAIKFLIGTAGFFLRWL